MLVEAYVDQLATAVAAERAGAGRLELCGPGEGGLTPSAELLGAVLAAVRIPVHVMVRPREGDFHYAPAECAAMRDAVLMARRAGAAGVVFGISQDDGALDLAAMAELIVLARPLRVGVHRAFDRVPDADAALDGLIALGVDVVLTSGLAATAEEGVPVLARLVQRAAGRIVVMPGGGVRAHNVRRIVAATRATEVHARASDAAAFAALVRAANA